MKILVVGGGGREHAIITKIKQNKSVSKIYALPGNGGIARDAECVNIGAKDIDAIVNFAVENKIDYAIVAPMIRWYSVVSMRLKQKGSLVSVLALMRQLSREARFSRRN